MSARLEYEVRLRLRAALRHLGTPPVGNALLVLAAVFVTVEQVWARVGDRAAASALGVSLAYHALAAALVVDGLVSLSRALPRDGEPGAARLAGQAGPGDWARVAFGASRALAGVALLASVLARDVFTLRIAEGEDTAVDSGQIVDRDPARRMSPGPFPIALAVRRVEGLLAADGTVRGLAVEVRRAGSATAWATPWRPLWFGFGRLLFPIRAGFTPRYAIETSGGALVEAAFAKLDLFPEGRRASVRASQVPYRFAVALARDQAAGNGLAPVVDVAVYRGKLLVGQGTLAPGASLEFEGLKLRFPEWRRWAEFRMIRDPGIGIAAVAGLVATLAWLASRAARRVARSQERGP